MAGNRSLPGRGRRSSPAIMTGLPSFFTVQELLIRQGYRRKGMNLHPGSLRRRGLRRGWRSRLWRESRFGENLRVQAAMGKHYSQNCHYQPDAKSFHRFPSALGHCIDQIKDLFLVGPYRKLNNQCIFFEETLLSKENSRGQVNQRGIPPELLRR
jgi:hypothetical protein